MSEDLGMQPASEPKQGSSSGTPNAPQARNPVAKPGTSKSGFQAVTGRFTTKSQRIRYFLMQKEKLDSILLSLHTGCGVEFCLNMLDEDGTMWVSNSEDAATWNQWTKSKETFPAHITMARWERERDALTTAHQQDLGLFSLEQQRTIVSTLISTVIPNQETWFPYNKSRTTAVGQAFAWWPADVDYQDPANMSSLELRKVFDAALAGNKALEHHIKREIGKLGLASSEHELLHRLVSAGVRDASEIVAIPPAPAPPQNAGQAALRAVDQDMVAWPSVDYPASFGGGLVEPEVEVGPDEKLYLGAGPTNSESIKRCIESHGIGFLKKKMVCVKIAGTEVGLAHFYNAVLGMGGIHLVRGKIDQERALARELLISPQASKNWRKLMWEAWDRVFPKITNDDEPKPPGPLQLCDVTTRPGHPGGEAMATMAALPGSEAQAQHEMHEMNHATTNAGAAAWGLLHSALMDAQGGASSHGAMRQSTMTPAQQNNAATAAMHILRAALPGALPHTNAPPPPHPTVQRPTPRKRFNPRPPHPLPSSTSPTSSPNHYASSPSTSPARTRSPPPAPRAPPQPAAAEDATAAAELVLQAAAAAAHSSTMGQPQSVLHAAAIVATEALMAAHFQGLDPATGQRLDGVGGGNGGAGQAAEHGGTARGEHGEEQGQQEEDDGEETGDEEDGRGELGGANGAAPRRSARNEGKENPALASVLPKKRVRMEADAAAAAAAAGGKRTRTEGDE